MKHFVIIRFRFRPEDPYLDLRYRYLHEIALHSLEQQNNKNFKSVVISNLDNIKSDIVLKSIPLAVVNQLPQYHDPDEFVLTTRLDMDDVLLPNFVNRVQKAFRPIDELVIDPIGYNYDVRNNKMILTSPSSPSNFLTFVEKGDTPRYCFHKKHPLMRCYKKIKINEPLRIFCFHDNSMLMSKFKPGVYTKGPSIDTSPYTYYINTLREINNLMKERMRDERHSLC